MTPDQLVQGGVVGLLAIIVVAFYTGRVTTKQAADEANGKVIALWAERFADAILDRDGWKSQAQQLAPAVEKMANELEIANQRDEEWRQAFTSQGSPGTIPDRRATT